MRCINCEASCRQAPSEEYLSIEQIEKFVDSAKKLKYDWDFIRLRGGEPTLHPQFLECIEIIKKYKDFNPHCKIVLVTNGAGEEVKAVLAKIPNWIHVTHGNMLRPKEEKRYDYASFNTYNEAPIDLWYYKFEDFTKGCYRIKECYGLALSRYGYYPCSPGANVDRVFGFDIGIKELSLVDEKALRNQMKILCRYCGHFKEPNYCTAEEKVSASWEKAYKRYKKQEIKLSLY